MQSMVVLLFSLMVSPAVMAAPTLSDAAILQAAQEEIQVSTSTGNTDTECSDYVSKVLQLLGVPVKGFYSNDFDKIMAAQLPNFSVNEFTTFDLAQGRASLQSYLNSFTDHTAFFAQWTREGQSGHVAIIEKVAEDQYTIYEAQGGLSLPHTEAAPVSSLLYGALPVNRSHLRLYSIEAAPH